MIYIKVVNAEPFVIVCDGRYQQQLAYQRLDRYPFSFVRTEEIGPRHNLLEITLYSFLNLHNSDQPQNEVAQ